MPFFTSRSLYSRVLQAILLYYVGKFSWGIVLYKIMWECSYMYIYFGEISHYIYFDEISHYQAK